MQLGSTVTIAHTSSPTTTDPRLIRRSPHSFDVDDLIGFAAWLNAHGFRQIAPSRSVVEYGRWERSQRLVIVYTSGAVVVQGVQPEPCLALLASLVVEHPAQETAVRS